MVSQIVIGVDLGTQSIKTVIYDAATKTQLKTASSPLDLISRKDGSREQLAVWWTDGLGRCLEQLSTETRASVVAIGVSGQQHGFVPVDKNGDVLAPVKLWCDTATVPECDTIIDRLGGAQRCRDIAGNSIAVGYTASKILWLKENDPQAYQAMSSVMLPHDFLNFHMTGRRTMECGDASGTGLFDVRRRCWSEEVLRSLDEDRDLRKCFPDPIEAWEPAGTLRPEFAGKYGLSEDVVVSAGGGDNMMAAIGTGNVSNGSLTASMGTSGTLFGFSDQPIVDEQGELASFCSSTGGWLPLLCTMNCTVATEQLRSLFGIEVERIEQMAADSEPGANGVITLPFYNGERTPNLPHGKAVIFGLDLENSRQSNLLRSAMESAVFGLKTGLLAFQRNGMQFDTLTLTGGGSTSRVWRQICADVLNLPVRVLRETENAAFGALLQALWCYRRAQGEACDLESLVDSHLVVDNEKCCTPDRDAVTNYENVFQDYKALLEAVTPLYQ